MNSVIFLIFAAGLGSVGFNSPELGYIIYLILLLIFAIMYPKVLKDYNNDSEKILNELIKVSKDKLDEYEFANNIDSLENIFKNEVQFYKENIKNTFSNTYYDYNSRYKLYDNEELKQVKNLKHDFVYSFHENLKKELTANEFHFSICSISNILTEQIVKHFNFQIICKRNRWNERVWCLDLETDYKNFETLFLSKYAEFYPDCELSKYYKRMKEAEELGILEDV